MYKIIKPFNKLQRRGEKKKKGENVYTRHKNNNKISFYKDSEQ